MSAEIRVLSMRSKAPDNWTVINVCSNSTDLGKGLSPFYLGPCHLYGGIKSRTVENAWQYAKVYEEHTNEYGHPTQDYWDWAIDGWANPRAVRYPMGRGAKPLYSLWEDEHLDYIDARKRIYIPVYSRLARKSKAFAKLIRLHIQLKSKQVLALRDFDGYDHKLLNMDLVDVVDESKRKMGHAFVLAMMLEGVV